MSEERTKYNWLALMVNAIHHATTYFNPLHPYAEHEYRAYTDNSRAEFLGNVLTNKGFYDAYWRACKLWYNYKDTLSLVHVGSGEVM